MSWFLLGLAILLGIRHASAPDHVMAVTTYVEQNHASARSGIGYALRIGLGHSLGMIIMGIAVLFLLHHLPGAWGAFLSRVSGVWISLFSGLILANLWFGKEHSVMRKRLGQWIGSRSSAWILGVLLGLAVAPGDLAIFGLMTTVPNQVDGALLLISFLFAMLASLIILGAGLEHFHKLGRAQWHHWTTNSVGVLGMGVGLALLSGILH